MLGDQHAKSPNDPREFEGRSPGFLHSCRHARDVLQGKYRKQDAPWLALEEYAGDAEAAITFNEFRTLAWEAANEKARGLGWIKSCGELHEEVKRAAHGPD